MNLETLNTPAVVTSQNRFILYVNPCGQKYFKEVLGHELTVGLRCYIDINKATHKCQYCPLNDVLLRNKVVNLDFTSEITGIRYRITCIPHTYNGEMAIVEFLERIE